MITAACGDAELVRLLLANLQIKIDQTTRVEGRGDMMTVRDLVQNNHHATIVQLLDTWK